MLSAGKRSGILQGVYFILGHELLLFNRLRLGIYGGSEPVSNQCPSTIIKLIMVVSNSEMSNFCSDQGRTRVYGEAYVLYAATENPRPPARRAYASERERRTGQKGPFMDGH